MPTIILHVVSLVRKILSGASEPQARSLLTVKLRQRARPGRRG